MNDDSILQLNWDHAKVAAFLEITHKKFETAFRLYATLSVFSLFALVYLEKACRQIFTDAGQLPIFVIFELLCVLAGGLFIWRTVEKISGIRLLGITLKQQVAGRLNPSGFSYNSFVSEKEFKRFEIRYKNQMMRVLTEIQMISMEPYQAETHYVVPEGEFIRRFQKILNDEYHVYMPEIAVNDVMKSAAAIIDQIAFEYRPKTVDAVTVVTTPFGVHKIVKVPAKGTRPECYGSQTMATKTFVNCLNQEVILGKNPNHSVAL